MINKRKIETIKEKLSETMAQFMFEPYDVKTFYDAKRAVTKTLGYQRRSGAIYDYLVVCDRSNNPQALPNRVGAKQFLKVDVAIQFTPKSKFIYIPIKVG